MIRASDNSPDFLVIGAGPVGCTIAERLAEINNQSVLLVDKRNHIGGNCYDCIHSSGLLVHKYGPHYFRTNNVELLKYLSQFTDWINGDYFVKSKVGEKLFPFPINLTTLEMFFKCTLDENSARSLLATKAVNIDNPQNSEEFVLSRVGRELYESFYLNYTIKQWERHPRDLDSSVCGRIPIRFNRDERYVEHRFQLIPRNGYTSMFERMTSHPRIRKMLRTDYRDLRNEIKPRYATIYCGPLDEYFDFKLGKLPWRSLNFEFVDKSIPFVQPCVQINYPNDFQYTRSVEYKHITKQPSDNTVLSYEYPTGSGDPYYPVPAAESRNLFLQYRELSAIEQETKNVYFAGRLANYRYINMDESFEKALDLYAHIARTFFR